MGPPPNPLDGIGHRGHTPVHSYIVSTQEIARLAFQHGEHTSVRPYDCGSDET